MAKLDRLGWADGLSFSPFGFPIGIRSNEPEILPALHALISEFGWKAEERETVRLLLSLWVGRPSGRRGQRPYHLLYGAATRLVRTLEIADILTFLRASLPDIARSTASGHFFFSGSVFSLANKLFIIIQQECEDNQNLQSAMVGEGCSLLSSPYFAVDPEARLCLPTSASYKESFLCFVSSSQRTLLKDYSKGAACVRLLSCCLGLHTDASGIMRAASDLVQASTCLQLEVTSVKEMMGALASPLRLCPQNTPNGR